MHTLPKPPRPPSGFDAFLRIAHRGVPFTAVDGRAFMTVPALSSGYHTFPIRSRAFRRWFFDQCLSDYDTICVRYSGVAHFDTLIWPTW
jgi:hypothetical protein